MFTALGRFCVRRGRPDKDMCGPSAGCGIQAIVRDGKFVGIESWPEAPLNHGKNCPNAHAAPQWVYSERRLKHPMKRIGATAVSMYSRACSS
jgi:anaerobic selenocysteine-containing dehydrogenase